MVIENNSICIWCRHCGYEAAHVSAHAEDDHPEMWWCEEDSGNFGTEDGCRRYEEIPIMEKEERDE